MTKWGVFLDRDGTLVPNVHYAVEPSQLRLYRTAAAALARLIDQHARLVVVSNQSAVARGLLSRAGLHRMDARLKSLLAEEGVRLARAYYCPHHPQWGGPCRCRKPKPGLIRDGLKSLGLEASRCYLIGDSMDDMGAGRAAGLRTVLVLTGHGRRDRNRVVRAKLADHVAGRLSSAVGWILEDRRRQLGPDERPEPRTRGNRRSH